MASHYNNDYNELGREGEALTWVKLSSLEMDLTKPNGLPPYDLEARHDGKLWFVECKIARPGYDKATQAWRYRAALRNHDFDMLVFWCKLNDTDKHPFVIPRSALEDVNSVVITSLNPINYQGGYAPYYNAWYLFNTLEPIQF